MKQYAVIGLGNFGNNLAMSLSKKGHQVLVMDIDKDRVDAIQDSVTDAIVGDIRNKKMLAEFISASFDAVIVSIGQNLEGSILATHYLKEMKVKYIIVKAINEDHAELLKIMGADEIIFPEKDMAEWLSKRLTVPDLLEHIPLTSEFSIVELSAPEKFFGKSLNDLKLRTKYNVLVIAVKDVMRDSFILMPDANYKILPDNILVIMGRSNDIDALKL